MIPNVFFATTIIFIAIGFLLLQECTFLIPYRDEKRRYADAAHEELYRRWLIEGESGLRRNPPSEMVQGSFRTMLIPHDYDVLGGLQRAS